ncbi:MAG: AcrR family transcriptional regulator [Candidatus Poriferisodalaceae bacterium]|jgi:AcrR family transcriptional regulator
MTGEKAEMTSGRRQRLSPAEREGLIVEGAIKFFAEVGFSGHTRELAQRLGVTQPLLYRYFPTKQDLIERVYEELFVGRWKPEWGALIADRTLPLRERLVEFYTAYANEALTYEWIRIYMFAGLAGEDLNRRYIGLLEDQLLAPLCEEFRAAAGAPAAVESPLTPRELESAWQIHATVYYYFVRKFIYESKVEENLEAFISDVVDRTLDGAFSAARQPAGAS